MPLAYTVAFIALSLPTSASLGAVERSLRASDVLARAHQPVSAEAAVSSAVSAAEKATGEVELSGTQSGFNYRVWDVSIIDIHWGNASFPRSTPPSLLGVAPLPSAPPAGRTTVHAVLGPTRIRAKFRWKYALKHFPYIPRGSGWVDVRLPVKSLAASFTPALTRSPGSPGGVGVSLRLRAVSAKVDGTVVQVHGSWLSWAYDGILYLLRRKVDRWAAQGLEAAAAEADKAGDQLLSHVT